MAKGIQSIVNELHKDSPLLTACKQPQLMFVPHQNYGLKQLYARLHSEPKRNIQFGNNTKK